MDTTNNRDTVLYNDHAIDALALDAGVRAMHGVPSAVALKSDHVPLPLCETTRTSLKLSQIPAKLTRHAKDELPHQGHALTYWMRVDEHKSKDSALAEKETFKIAKDFCRALRHAYQMPLKAAYNVETTQDGKKVLAIVLATDNKHTQLLEDEVLSTIKDAYAACKRERNNGLYSAPDTDNISGYFPEPLPTPEIDTLRSEACLIDTQKYLSTEQAQLAISDFMANKVGLISYARTDDKGSVHIPLPPNGDFDFRRETRSFTPDEATLPYDQDYRKTRGLSFWLDPKLHGAPLKADKTMARLLRDRFRQGVADMFPNVEVDIQTINVSKPEDKQGAPVMGMLLRVPRNQQHLLSQIKDVLQRGVTAQHHYEHDTKRDAERYPRTASRGSDGAKGR